MHKGASAWAGENARGARALSSGRPRHVPANPLGQGPRRAAARPAQQGRRDPAPPVRDVTLSAPKLVSPHAMVGCDDRIVEVHDWTVDRTLAGIEEHAAGTHAQLPGYPLAPDAWQPGSASAERAPSERPSPLL